MSMHIGKCWQVSSEHLLFMQISLPQGVAGLGGKNKGYLVIQYAQAHRKISFAAEKPAAKNLHANDLSGNLSQYWRKHADGLSLLSHLADSEWGDVLQFGRSDGAVALILWLSREKPPVLGLIDQKGVRQSAVTQNQTFTKKQDVTESLPLAVRDGLTKTGSGFAFLEDKGNAPDSSEETLAAKENTPPKDASSQALRALRQQLKRKEKTLKKALSGAQRKVASLADVDQAKAVASWLKDHIDTIDNADHEVVIPLPTGDEVFSWKKRLGPGGNLDKAFHQAKRLARSRDDGLAQVQEVERHLLQLQQDIALCDQAPETVSGSIELGMRKRHGLVTQKVITANSTSKANRAGTATLGRKFLLVGGCIATLGRAAAENDQITKAAKSNDLWLHAVDGTGAHVILSGAGRSNAGDRDKLWRQGAILALHFSRFKTSQSGEVYVARRGDIKKPKGWAPGLWQVTRAQRLRISFMDVELAQIMSEEVT